MPAGGDPTIASPHPGSPPASRLLSGAGPPSAVAGPRGGADAPRPRPVPPAQAVVRLHRVRPRGHRGVVRPRPRRGRRRRRAVARGRPPRRERDERRGLPARATVDPVKTTISRPPARRARGRRRRPPLAVARRARLRCEPPRRFLPLLPLRPLLLLLLLLLGARARRAPESVAAAVKHLLKAAAERDDRGFRRAEPRPPACDATSDGAVTRLREALRAALDHGAKPTWGEVVGRALRRASGASGGGAPLVGEWFAKKNAKNTHAALPGMCRSAAPALEAFERKYVSGERSVARALGPDRSVGGYLRDGLGEYLGGLGELVAGGGGGPVARDGKTRASSPARTPAGKTRAWIHAGLERGDLGDRVAALGGVRELVAPGRGSYYDPGALLADEEATGRVAAALRGLQALPFDRAPGGDALDAFEESAEEVARREKEAEERREKRANAAAENDDATSHAAAENDDARDFSRGGGEAVASVPRASRRARRGKRSRRRASSSPPPANPPAKPASTAEASNEKKTKAPRRRRRTRHLRSSPAANKGFWTRRRPTTTFLTTTRRREGDLARLRRRASGAPPPPRPGSTRARGV